MKNGFFITFEGVVEAGKSTQLNLLKKHLLQKGFDVVDINLGENLDKLSDRSELFYKLADFAKQVDNIIVPALNSGKVVLCENYTESFVAHLAYGKGMNLTDIQLLNDIAVDDRKPDLTFVFDINEKICSKRTKNGFGDDKKNNEFFNNVRFGYFDLAKQNFGRMKIIDGEQSVENIFKLVVEEFEKNIKQNDIKFSVVMPTFNRAYCIENAINSLLAQTYQNFELIISDDGSSDGTEDLIKTRYKTELSNGIIKYFKSDKNEGQSSARNKALKLVSGDWIAYLDSDNMMWKNFLYEFKMAIFANPQVKCLYSKFHFERNGQSLECSHAFDYKQLQEANFIDMGTFVHHISLLEKYGNFDTSLKSLEDWDLILRYTKENEPYFIDKMLLEYVISSDRVSSNGYYNESLEKIRAKQ